MVINRASFGILNHLKMIKCILCALNGHCHCIHVEYSDISLWCHLALCSLNRQNNTEQWWWALKNTRTRDNNPKSSSSPRALTVMDMNDNAPRFEQTSYNCLLSQHAVRGQFVTIVSASDPDYIDADNLIYSIAEGNELQTYAIDPISGIITLINMQNFAENHSTILNISVSDSVYTSFIRVQINILPANLHNPVFPHLVYDVKINENQMAGRLVITVSCCLLCLFFVHC